MTHSECINFKGRDELRKLLIEALSQQTEIFQIFFFGKEVEGRDDEFSDFDVIVCSNDLVRTQNNYKKVFNSISPIVGTYLLESSVENLSKMIMLRDFSPYQKIDFSIVNDIKLKKRLGFGPFSLVYENIQEQRIGPSKLNVVQVDQTENQLNDFLFAVPRFTKCLFRKDVEMYRRWKSISDITLVLLYEKYFGWAKEVSRKKLSAKEANILYGKVSDKERHLLEKIFPTTAKLDIVSSYQLCIDLLIELSQQKLKSFEIKVNNELIDHIRNFLDLEIKRYREKAF